MKPLLESRDCSGHLDDKRWPGCCFVELPCWWGSQTRDPVTKQCHMWHDGCLGKVLKAQERDIVSGGSHHFPEVRAFRLVLRRRWWTDRQRAFWQREKVGQKGTTLGNNENFGIVSTQPQESRLSRWGVGKVQVLASQVCTWTLS
jgi:hypothetical protein